MGSLIRLEFSVQPTAFLGSSALFIVMGIVGVAILRLDVGEAIALGVLSVASHWLAALGHQLGHSRAARQSAHPMRGIRFGNMGLLSTAVYPSDEPVLPASIHIRRAWGGPKASAALTVMAAVLVLASWNTIALLKWGSLFFFVDNILVFTLGSLLPLGFTDGSTILHWRGKHNRDEQPER